MKKRIGIDARFYGTFGKGLGRYAQKLIENLEIIENENPDNNREYFVFLRKENFDEYEPKNRKFQKVLADYHWYTFSEQINMPRILNKYNLDLVHFPHFNVPIFYFKPFIVTIHDLILLNFPTIRGTTLSPLWYQVKFLAYKLTIGLGIKRARKVIAVSRFTKKDILDHYHFAKDKLAVTYEGCDEHKEARTSKEEALRILKKYGVVSGKRGIIKSYILYVGNAYPHKNLEKLVHAFGLASKKRDDLHLLLVGKEDFFYSRLKNVVEDLKIKNVIFAGFVPDEDLKVVYENAKFYIFPSLYEGFGLPPLEAMSRGIAVASSDHECMREILGDSAYFFDGRDENEIVKAILKLHEDHELREELIKKGDKRFRLYSWKDMGKKTLDIYQEFLSE